MFQKSNIIFEFDYQRFFMTKYTSIIKKKSLFVKNASKRFEFFQ